MTRNVQWKCAIRFETNPTSEKHWKDHQMPDVLITFASQKDCTIIVPGISSYEHFTAMN